MIICAGCLSVCQMLMSVFPAGRWDILSLEVGVRNLCLHLFTGTALCPSLCAAFCTKFNNRCKQFNFSSAAAALCALIL